MYSFLLCTPVSAASTSKLFPFMHRHHGSLRSAAGPSHRLPICWGRGLRIQEMDAVGQSHGVAVSPHPAALGWCGRTRCSAQRFDLQFTPSGESALQCLCLWDSCMSRAWRWALVKTMQAAGVLSAKPCVSILHPTLWGCKRQLCHTSPHWYFCSSAFVHLEFCNTHRGPAKHPPSWKERE